MRKGRDDVASRETCDRHSGWAISTLEQRLWYTGGDKSERARIPVHNSSGDKMRSSMRGNKKPFTYRRFVGFRLAVAALLSLAAATSLCIAADVQLTPRNASGIYKLGEAVRWTASRADGAPADATKFSYIIRKNNLDVIKSGELDLTAGKADIETSANEPAMLYLEVKPATAPSALDNPRNRIAAGAAVEPTALQPAVGRPSDFDEFWQSKIKMLEQIPTNPELTPGDGGDSKIEYATIKMDHINGTHVYGHIAKPKGDGKFPALVIFQWASPPYPLQKSWVTGHASNGWLTLNIEPHDVLPDQP